MIVPVLSFLLMFLSESEVFCVAREMLETSRILLDNRKQSSIGENIKAMRWHLTFRNEEFNKFLDSFFDYVKENSVSFNQINKHFHNINFHFKSLFEMWTRNLFYKVLPLSVINFLMQIFHNFLKFKDNY